MTQDIENIASCADEATISDMKVPETIEQKAEQAPENTKLTAASDAAAFVAQIFQDEDAAAQAAAPAADAQADLPLAPAEWPPIPAAWPQGADQPLHGQRVLVLGLGASGLAMARWCARAGAQVTVADTRAAPPQLAVLQAQLPEAQFIAGPFTAELIAGQGVTSVYRSPGLTPHDTAPVLDAARAIGLPVGGELDLFARALAALARQHGYAPKVLAITGTNGKTTVTALTGQLLEHAGLTVAVAGNIGPSLLDTLTQRIAAQDLPQAWVLELSSFQLDGVQDFAPTAAVVLNVTQDHLDWHGSMAAYAAAKARIFGAEGCMVLNRQDCAVMDMLPAPVQAKGKAKGKGGKLQPRWHVTFGNNLPQQPGDFGLEEVNGMRWLVRAHDEAGPDGSLYLQRLLPADALRIRGLHNACNALAALALAQAAGCPLAPLLYGLREYRGEPHRVQSIGVVEGVEYFDDSKGTNVGATVAALHGLGPQQRIVLILGGVGKGQDFAPLADPIAQYVRAVVLIGRDAPHIRQALAHCGVALHDAADLPGAVQLARAQAQSGDAVLLSPACASLDMFRDYAHRAEVFVAAVQALAEDAGQVLEAGG
ncbi:MAG: UDP-N-acetylmuramoyl-L-alanine--D-glutamate ligase [Comamonas sp.]|nr:UDP-N-acetylmuramoyl-L-alanine--D-glutamate ligase [Comamonas sp.]